MRPHTTLRYRSPLALTLLLVAGCATTPSSESPLEELLACHDAAVGGDSVRAIREIEVELDIVEPTYRLRGDYVASRDGSMRIDVYAGDQRVFSEGLRDGRAWKMAQDDTAPIEVGSEPAAALRHGLEKPGRFWTLADMRSRGHDLVLEGRERSDGQEFYVLLLTLDDGHTVWYWVGTESCLIERSRDFRAFHPDVDPEKIWIETRYDDFRRVDGVMHAHRVTNVDVETGEVIGTTTVLSVRTSTSASR